MGGVRKVGIIGISHVGAHVAQGLILQGVADELYVCDINESRLTSEVQDLSDTLSFCPHDVKIHNCAADYEAMKDCEVIINAAGDIVKAAVNRDGELYVTTAIAETFAQRIGKSGFTGIFINIANPCEVVSTEIWKLTGLPWNHVIGLGTMLDSARFQNALQKATGIDQKSIGAYMLGEHGARQFAAWSHVTFGGKPLVELAEENPQQFGFAQDAVEDQARQGGYVTYAGKGCTEYAVSAAAVKLTMAVLHNEHAILACSTLPHGAYGLEGHFVSLPCIIGADGVESIIELKINEREREGLMTAWNAISSNLSKMQWWHE
ncbi:MAG: hypothetical protein PHO79_07325 [Desulfoplanes sp.]|nr:hypothetical protein [Desulfoplanes sp.]